MLQIKNLNLTHKKDLKTILENFSCTFNDGQKAVIIGEEGNGKSTLLRWIFDPELVEDYCEAVGERIILGQSMGYLPQELPAGDRGKTVWEFFMEDGGFPDRSPRELGRLAREFGVSPDFFYREQTVGTLSGGEKVKAQIMRILLSDPHVLLLDEPSNDIDLETLEWLEKLILKWTGIVIFISHDETLIERTANMVIHMEQIRRKTKSRYTVAAMPYEQYQKERFNQFERQARMAENDRREKKIRDEKYRRICQSVDHAQNAVSRQDPFTARLLKIGRAHV